MSDRPKSADEGQRAAQRPLFSVLGYEVLPVKSAEQEILAHVTPHPSLIVTASAGMGCWT